MKEGVRERDADLLRHDAKSSLLVDHFIRLSQQRVEWFAISGGKKMEGG